MICESAGGALSSQSRSSAAGQGLQHVMWLLCLSDITALVSGFEKKNRVSIFNHYKFSLYVLPNSNLGNESKHFYSDEPGLFSTHS